MEGKEHTNFPLRFTGQAKPDKIDFTVNYLTGYQDAELCDTLAEALKALAIALGEARSHNIEHLPDEERAVREVLLGFSILAYNETRAFLMVAAGGLELHARIHYRSVMEYEFKTKTILNTPSRALAFLKAFAHEFRKLGSGLNITEEALNTHIIEALGLPVESASEKRALYGKPDKKSPTDVKSAMAESAEGSVRYLATFSVPSMVSHGGIVALRDVARAIDGAGSDFLDIAARETFSINILYGMIWPVLYFAGVVATRFGFSVAEHIEPVGTRALASNQRLKIISPEAAARAREIHEQTKFPENPSDA
jgi:hypothetical protein